MTDPTHTTAPFLGILMLDTRFERPLGDAGNPASYPFPARLAVVKGAGSLEIVRDGKPSDAHIEAFIQTARQLEAEGAAALTSTCGFLITIQDELARAVAIPVLLSALCSYARIKRHHPSGRIGILTASKTALGDTALLAAGINNDDVVIEGLEQCQAFANAILRPKSQQTGPIDRPAIEQELIAKARGMMAKHHDLQAFLLECGNLPPYQQALHQATGLPVYSLLDAVTCPSFAAGLLRPK
ncbi:aspartate/glutamate racemase family protein [Cohaesibacter intestini]|uniref:aspartate/glutamate racemase family protein n=1 Tax=Cohaesibacter intestini TaxID=2211145 RepID=UPI000DE9AA07|nr:aspartate/glutamate racemase family protein [Cohaesibacter intestini]